MSSFILSPPLLRIVKRLKPKDAYGVVHLRTEEDWRGYARRRAKVVYWNPEQILKSALVSVPPTVTSLYLVGGHARKVLKSWCRAFHSLKSKSFRVTCRLHLLKDSERLAETMQAALDFEVAKGAAWFMGHKFSSFSLEAIYDGKPHQLYPN
jgi:hypothetical protein